MFTINSDSVLLQDPSRHIWYTLDRRVRQQRFSYKKGCLSKASYKHGGPFRRGINRGPREGDPEADRLRNETRKHVILIGEPYMSFGNYGQSVILV